MPREITNLSKDDYIEQLAQLVDACSVAATAAFALTSDALMFVHNTRIGDPESDEKGEFPPPLVTDPVHTIYRTGSEAMIKAADAQKLIQFFEHDRGDDNV